MIEVQAELVLWVDGVQLYTATTIVLVLQVLYYDHWPSRRKSSGFVSQAKV